MWTSVFALSGQLAGGRWHGIFCSSSACCLNSRRSASGMPAPCGSAGCWSCAPSPAFSPRLQDPFVAFHIDKGLVRKYMNSLLIGELSPEQPSFEPTKNVRPCLCLGALVVEGEGAESQPGWSPKGALSQLPGNSGPPEAQGCHHHHHHQDLISWALSMCQP